MSSVCACTLDSDTYGDHQAPEPVPCEREISACRWMPIKQFFNLPFYRRRHLFSDLMRQGHAVAAAALQGDAIGMELTQTVAKRGPVGGSLFAVARAKL